MRLGFRRNRSSTGIAEGPLSTNNPQQFETARAFVDIARHGRLPGAAASQLFVHSTKPSLGDRSDPSSVTMPYRISVKNLCGSQDGFFLALRDENNVHKYDPDMTPFS